MAEYEWKPPRCGSCSVLGHEDSQCPKPVVSESRTNLGFDLRKRNGPIPMKNIAALNDRSEASKKQGNERKNGPMTSKNDTTNTASSSSLKENGKIFKNVGTSIAANVGNTVKDATKVVEESDSVVDDVYDEMAQFMSCGCANDASLLKDGDYDIYDGYENKVFDLTKEKLALCDVSMERVCNQPNFNTRADGAAEDDNDNGWQTVEKRRNKAQKLNRTTTYFFTDIPPGWNDNDLWKLFAKYGRISDVYIAKKKTAKGKDFGFARFLNVSNPTSFETTLNSITIGNYRLSINIARYQHQHQQRKHGAVREFVSVTLPRELRRVYHRVSERKR
ncbi:RNA-directed DNA polymerase, eukaryota [Tanacetum coccineum]